MRLEGRLDVRLLCDHWVSVSAKVFVENDTDAAAVRLGAFFAPETKE